MGLLGSLGHQVDLNVYKTKSPAAFRLAGSPLSFNCTTAAQQHCFNKVNYFLNFLLAYTPIPRSPDPRSNMVAGSGTALGSEVVRSVMPM